MLKYGTLAGCFFVLVFCVFQGCKGDSPLKPTDETPGGSTETPYEVEATVSSVHAGQEGTPSFQVTPQNGYKWNEEFPARVSVKVSDGAVASISKKEWLKGDFRKAQEARRVAIPYLAGRVGKTEMTVEARFSVCDDERCLIESKTLTTQVEVLSEN